MSLNPIDNVEAFDAVTIAGMVSPGLAQVSCGERTYAWDVKETKGSSGGSYTYQGEKVQQGFKIKFLLWTSDHFDAWETFRSARLEKPQASKQPDAQAITHPWLAELGVTDVVVGTIGGCTHEGKALYSYTVAFTQWKPAKKAGGTASTSKASTGGDKDKGPDTAGSAADKQIAALMQQAKAA